MTKYSSQYDAFEQNLATFHDRTLELMHEGFTETKPGVFAIKSSVMDGFTISDESTDAAEIEYLGLITKEASELQLLGRLVTLNSGEIQLTRYDLQNGGTIETATTDHPVTGKLDGVVLLAGVPNYQLSLMDLAVDTLWLKGRVTPRAISKVALNGLEMPQFQQKRKAAGLPFEGTWEFSPHTNVMDSNGTRYGGGAAPIVNGVPVVGDIFPPTWSESPWKS